MSSIQFTALIRVPFARGDFVEPPQVSWNAAKDRSLWKVVSKTSKASELNWVELADNFNVPPSFLLQQAAWLYERHLDHVRAQFKKVGGGAPSSLGLDSTHTAMGGIPMRRAGSGDSGGYRPPSTLPIRARDSPAPPGESSMPAPPLSRTPSTNTITQSRALPQQPLTRQPGSKQPQKFEIGRPDGKNDNKDEIEKSRSSLNSDSVLAQSSSSGSSSLSDANDNNNPLRRSQLFKRPPRFRAQKPQRDLVAYNEEAEEDEHSTSTGTTLPFAKVVPPSSHISATSSTARVGRLSGAFKKVDASQGEPKSVSTSGIAASSSMASSLSDAPRPGMISPGPLSPAHRASIAKASPRGLGPKSGKEESEGTPSMGSSFSDIDDTSISQSALEEALLSNIQHGRSTLSQLRSRYL